MQYKTETFEKRNILNRQFKGSQFVNANLVEIDGIYYHYNLINSHGIFKNDMYKVIRNNGNQLTIKKV